jgi:hypothetical protein
MEIIRLAVDLDTSSIWHMNESSPHLAKFGLDEFRCPNEKMRQFAHDDDEFMFALGPTLIHALGRLSWNTILYDYLSIIINDGNTNLAWSDLRDTAAATIETVAQYLVSHISFFIESDGKDDEYPSMNIAMANVLLWPLAGFAKFHTISPEQRAFAKQALIRIGKMAKLPTASKMSKLFDYDCRVLQSPMRQSKEYTDGPDIFYHMHMLFFG